MENGQTTRKKTELRCPRCQSRMVHFRLKTEKMACRHCGHIGSIDGFRHVIIQRDVQE